MSKTFNSRNKGSGYERKVAKMMTDWWGGGNFSRVPASGGLHWGNDQRVAGDIIPPPESNFPFVTECKKREEWTMEHILLNIGQPKTWWEQVVLDARRVNLVPYLIFSRNRAKDFVMIPYDETLYSQLEKLNDDVMATQVKYDNIREEEQVFDVIVTTFETLSEVPKETILEYTERVDWDRHNKE